MPATIYHAKTITVADGTATSVARPSDWNSQHQVTIAPSGQEIIGAFSNGGNVTFGTNTAGYVTASAPTGTGGAGDGGNVIAAGGSTANSTGTVAFGNSNGVTFGLNGNTVTASHNGITSQSVQPVAYSAFNGDALFSTLSFADSNGVSFRIGTQGLYATVKTDYLTTAAQSGHSHGNIAFSGTNVSASFTSASNGLSINLSAPTAAGAQTGISGLSAGTTQMTSGTAVFANSNGVSFGVNGNTITASHNGITTAAQSNHSHGVTLALTNLSGTTGGNSNGITISLSANPAGAGGDGGNVIAAGGSTAATTGTVVFSNSNGVSFGLNGATVTASHNGLTTAAQSNHTHGNPALNLTNISGTTASASNGLTLSLSGNPAQTTQTQPAGNIAGVGTTFAGTNVSGSMTFNSNGLNLALSAPAPGGGGAINVSAGTTSNNLQTIQFDNANGVSFGLNGSTITASVNAGGGGITEDNYFPHKDAIWAAHQVGQNSIQVQPLAGVPVFSYDRLAYGVQFSGATNSTLTVSATVRVGFYTLNGSSLSLLTSGSGSFSINAQGTANSTINSGPRWATMTLNGGTTVGGDDLWVAFISSTNTAGANATVSNLMASRVNSTWSGFMGVGTANSVQSLPGMGFYSTTSNALPSAMALSHITGVSSTAQRPQIFYLSNGAFVQ